MQPGRRKESEKDGKEDHCCVRLAVQLSNVTQLSKENSVGISTDQGQALKLDFSNLEEDLGIVNAPRRGPD